jgi:GH15 family glucan-1,4-alpha-glucosidase
VRRLGDSRSGLDSAAAWAARPFPQPRLYPAARAALRRLVEQGTRFGITPGEAWSGRDPWSAPTAWSAWSFAALAKWDRKRGARAAAREDRRLSLRLVADLRRAATPAATLPERVDAGSGIPRSTTPLAWSHAFAVLALLELWKPR